MQLTLLVAIGCVAVSLWAWRDNTQYYWHQWGFVPYRIAHNKEWYRFFTSIFFHSDWIHLLVNLLVFYSFGSSVERYYGKVLYAALLAAGIMGSGLATYIRYRKNPAHVSIGLSGVVNAVLFAFIVHNPQSTLLVFLVLPLPAWIFALIYIFYTIYEARRGMSVMNHWAHLGGAAAGMAFGYIVLIT
ncbi:MAG: rhomboid family intramembrane serine protease [Bacteroidia bacterium]|nr:rhomboid family intramembrane serine protease [Bacteroidia bacterium]MDW8134750.1 rhomboid family intramembrane serine protease [Bacteroidia bacterium]